MATPRLGGVMDGVLADPALTDAALEAIRHWLLALRDGRTRVTADRIVIHDSRSERDPPARLELLRTEGGWQVPGDAGCLVGTELAAGPAPGYNCGNATLARR